MSGARGGPGRSILRMGHPAQYVVVAFVGATLLGAMLLSIPAASHGPGRTSVMTALFTSASAVCVTGLAVVDTPGHWTALGEWIILALVQIGGLGIMTLTSLIVVVVGRRLGLRQRLIAAAETNSFDLGGIRAVLVGVAQLSFAVEAVVALALSLRFWWSHGEPLARAVYLGVFHSVSAFNNAGFSLFSENLVRVNRDPFILLVVAAAVVVGGVGFPVWVQLARNPRRPRRWSLHAKITVLTTAVLLVAGWVLLAWLEWTNPDTLGGLSTADSIVNALFHSVVPRTAGFNSVDVGAMREPSLLVTEVLMFIGGGSASTAGGIKVTTFALLGGMMWADLRGDPDVVMFERRIPNTAQRQALTVALLAIGVVVASTMVLLASSKLPRSGLFFEAVSALGTVGMSTGVTPLLSTSSQLIVVALMIIGRVGPPTLFAALVLRNRDRLYRRPEERPIIG
ncbi:MAG: TrkH family potassium uptake protein [Actinomycetota bacterium]|nr:TrkH family potassium uptake protein [Actinomycetota bacterium]